MDVRSGVSMFDPAEGLRRLTDFPFGLLTWVEASGYPMSAAVDFSVEPEADVVSFVGPAGFDLPLDSEFSLTGSHIRPQPGVGYDERRHVTIWGRPTRRDDGRLALAPTAAWGWDESSIPFPEYAERQVGQSRRYLARVSSEVGRHVTPKLSLGWLTLRATRLPFLSATFIPVILGIAIAAVHGSFDLFAAVLTLVGAAAVHLALNVANDVFDARLGADENNVNPTQFSGGSRVIQYGLVSLRRMGAISASLYAVAIGVGLILLLTRFSTALLVIGVLGVLLSFFYTAPPLKLVYRGLGELTTAIGFGPLMLVGAYVVQTVGVLRPEPFVASIPIALLVMLILYLNEVPDRPGDERAGKRTLPVRLPQGTVINGYLVAAIAAFAVIALGVLGGLLPIPALAALLPLPLVGRVRDGLLRYYDQPYGLMAFLAVNIKVHLYVGVLLIAAYLSVLVITSVAPSVPLFIRWN
ncbi:MAG TPA: prenyltransferase [Candidatus Limnocylindrales bacterium]|nr:prenyltransferase [Candidatus Limnocylindrales bacterium]